LLPKKNKIVMEISPIIKTEELLKISKNPDVMIFDASNGKNSRKNYEAEHIERAYFVDLHSQLAEVKGDFSLGGRHPLPSVENFGKTLTDYGVTKNTHIIIYDDKNGSNASARFWWMLKSAGHEKVQVLNGGLSHAKKNNFPLSSGTEVIRRASEPYLIENWEWPTVELSDVEKATGDSEYLIIDVRGKERFDGITEPIDQIAGHIPNAINIPFTENLDEDGLFLKPMELRYKYEATIGETNADNIIVHCGSGVTACHTLLALAYAKFKMPNLYIGSWSEWSRNNKVIEKTNS